MARMFNKYLVLRRDGTIPDWPYLVLGSLDPAVPYGIRALADESERRGMAADYIADLRRLADYMEFFRGEHGDGDPDAPPHRPDDPDVVGRITHGSTVPPGWVPGKPNPPGFPRFERHADRVMRERGADVAQQMMCEPCEYQGVLRPARKVTGIGWTPTCEWHHTHSWDSLAPKEAQ